MAVLVASLALPAVVRADGTVYVGNQGGTPSSVSQYAIGTGGLLSPLAPATAAVPVGFPGSIAIAPDGKSAYVLCGPHAAVCQYSIDPGSGALSPKNPATVAAGPAARDIAVAPDGNSAYITNDGGLTLSGALPGTISQYSIDPASGVLSPKNPATVAAGRAPNSIAVTPDGKSAYISNGVDGTISQYSIDPASGVLSPKNPATVAALHRARRIAVSPEGKSAYVIGGLSKDEVAQYDIDPVTGGLSPKTPATISVEQPNQVGGIGATDMAVSPDGKSAYVVHFGFRASSKISQLDIDPVSGVLSPKNPATFVMGSLSAQIAFSPDGTSAYISISSTWDDLGAVSQLSVDPNSGTLSWKTPGTVGAGVGPFYIAVGPLPRFPAGKEHCERGRWRDFPQFKNQGQCVAFVVRGA